MLKSSLRPALSSEVKRLRGRRKLSQAALADLSGVRQATISGIEQESGNPTVETMDALIKALEARIVFRLRDVKE
jgi:transcriptional regulator with XRE-family HTH domain